MTTATDPTGSGSREPVGASWPVQPHNGGDALLAVGTPPRSTR